MFNDYLIAFFDSVKSAASEFAADFAGKSVFSVFGLVFDFFVECLGSFRELYHGIIEGSAQWTLTNLFEFVLKVQEQDFSESVSTVIRVTVDLIEGFITTFDVFAFTLIGALPLGLIICFGSMSKFAPLKWLMKTVVWVIRGTPLMLQLIVVYYGPGLIGAWAEEMPDPNFIVSWLATWSVFDRFVAVIIAFIINYACYFSEIYRGGIESIPKGQYEACQVLGMSKSQTFFKVVLMQVVKRVIPPMGNEIITLVKDTSLARTIAVYEIIWSAQSFAKSDGLMWPMFYTAAFYLIFNGLLTVIFGKIEKKLDYYHN